MATPLEVDNSTSVILPHEDCHNPDKLWKKIEHSIKKNKIGLLPLDTPVFENKIRFVCISDTHNKTNIVVNKIPNADVLLHAGDFTSIGSYDEIKQFNEFLRSINQVKYKVVIAGNHDLTFENQLNAGNMNNYFAGIIKKQKDKNEDILNARDLLKNCIYLEDSFVNLYGLKIYGAPWQPWFGGWAFNVERGEKILEKWNKIPSDTDVLITHGPPLGFGDKVVGGFHVGCSELLATVRQRVKPKYHIFGHIHEDYGIWNDGCTTYINPSTCNLRYQGINDPIIFDIDVPSGFDKSWVLENK